MGTVRSGHLYEAEELLEQVLTWSEEEIENLPKLYREKAEQYRRLAKRGEA